MAEQWMGYIVAVDCGPRLGTFKGRIVKVNSSEGQSITLGNAERNGIPCTSNGITLRAQDIKNLEILEATASTSQSPPKSAFHAAVSYHHDKGPPTRDYASPQKFPADGFLFQQSNIDGSRSPSKKDRRLPPKWNAKNRDEATFGSPIDNVVLNEDFDFEKNLALFDKKAAYQKINATQKPEAQKVVDPGRQKFRHDENIIEAAPARYRQVKVPFPGPLEYVTDAGLVIPSISMALRDQLLGLAERLGLTFERQAELMGRAATEMALQLVGGGHRLHPNNVHQYPTVVALCGGHHSGVLGANCARHLASHGIRVLLLAPDSGTPIPPELYRELSLFRLTKNPILNSVTELPAHAVDLIILAADDPRGQGLAPSWLPAAAAWANESRAPVLAIDPPPQGSGVQSKLSLVGALPLSHGAANGKIYLCNLGIPVNIYQEVGITFSSPFGPKFVIPLHPSKS
ncbi:hypothetical protein B566_EDAN010055 [Ephemera danica]|nr:hypothetical protein B566_EDAN010055 [Ephemera danica]